MKAAGHRRPEVEGPASGRQARLDESRRDKKRTMLDLRMAIYAAQVDRMDQGIGRIIDA